MWGKLSVKEICLYASHKCLPLYDSQCNVNDAHKSGCWNEEPEENIALAGGENEFETPK